MKQIKLILIIILISYSRVFSQKILNYLDSVNYYIDVNMTFVKVNNNFEGIYNVFYPGFGVQIFEPHSNLGIRSVITYFQHPIFTATDYVMYGHNFMISYLWQRHENKNKIFQKPLLFSLGHSWDGILPNVSIFDKNYSLPDKTINVSLAIPISKFFTELTFYSLYQQDYEIYGIAKIFYRIKI